MIWAHFLPAPLQIGPCKTLTATWALNAHPEPAQPRRAAAEGPGPGPGQGVPAPGPWSWPWSWPGVPAPRPRWLQPLAPGHAAGSPGISAPPSDWPGQLRPPESRRGYMTGGLAANGRPPGGTVHKGLGVARWGRSDHNIRSGKLASERSRYFLGD